MINTVVTSILNWLAMSVLMPIGIWLADYWKIKKENKELKASIETLKNAKDKPSIDIAIDHIP